MIVSNRVAKKPRCRHSCNRQGRIDADVARRLLRNGFLRNGVALRILMVCRAIIVGGIFVGLGFLFPRASTLVIALLALTFAWGVEFSQLYHAPWIDALRATLPGRLVLGATFNWPDLPAYALGVGLGAWAEWRRRTGRRAG